MDRKKDLGKTEKEIKDNRSGAVTPTQDSNHGDMDLRLTNTTQSIQSVVVHHNAVVTRSPKKRCRDYDEKGFCMRGEMCPYDHGEDPVVLKDTALTRVLTYGPNGAPLTEAPPPMIPPPILGGPGHPVMQHMPPRPLLPEYNPQVLNKKSSVFINKQNGVTVQFVITLIKLQFDDLKPHIQIFDNCKLGWRQ